MLNFSLLPHAGLILVVAMFPDVAGFVFGGRNVTWVSALYGWAPS